LFFSSSLVLFLRSSVFVFLQCFHFTFSLHSLHLFTMGKITNARSTIGRGVPAYGRSRRFTVTQAYKNKPKSDSKKAAAPADTSSWYPAEDVSKPIPSRKSNHKPTRLRESITPGTVLIVLSGRFRGKRVVFLKQLESGLLLVTGPFRINGVPLRRLNQRYVIATSASVDVSSANVDKIDDAFFKRPNNKKTSKGVEQFFKRGDGKKTPTKPRQAAQKSVDTAVLSAVKAVPMMREYLNARFTLTKSMLPHTLKF
jgi:large subunit ribosomal protein L6e